MRWAGGEQTDRVSVGPSQAERAVGKLRAGSHSVPRTDWGALPTPDVEATIVPVL